MPPQVSTTTTSTLPTNAVPNTKPANREISGATIAICAVGGTLVIVGLGLALWLLRRRFKNTTPAMDMNPQQRVPRQYSLATSIATSAQPVSTINEKALLKDRDQEQERRNSEMNTTISTTSFSSPTMSETSQVPRPLEIFRNFSRKGRPKNLGHCRNGSQAKSVGGIYELPASPRRIFIPTARGNECRHTWVASDVPQDIRNKSLPEIPGETRQWI